MRIPTPPPIAAFVLAVGLVSATGVAQTCPIWSTLPVAQSPDGTVYQLVNFGNKLVARGTFTNVNGLPSQGFAEFDGGLWTPMNAGLSAYFGSNAPHSIAAWGGRVYATGPSSTGTNGRIWTGTTWIDWPQTGTNGGTGARPDVLFTLGDGKLLAGGYFVFLNDAGTELVFRRVAYWDGARWSMLSASQYGPSINQQINTNVTNHAVWFEGKTLIFGPPNIATGNTWNVGVVACPNGMSTFDGTSFAPFAGAALNGSILAAAVFNGELYVTGNFTATLDGSLSLNRIARYSGGQWHKVGNGLSTAADYMAVADDGTGERLHIFTNGSSTITAYNDPNSTTIDTVAFRGVVRFDGARFTPYGAALSSGMTGGRGYAAASYDPGTGTGLYIGGSSYSGGGHLFNTFARWGRGPMIDTDGDGIPDDWERNGIDIDCNGTIDLDLPAMGANWQRKDIFVEVDSMINRAPSQATLDRVVAAFNAVPNALVNNPNGQDGINLHLIVDPADQGITLANFPYVWRDFHDLKAQWFGTATERASPNRQAILDAKRQIFRYCIFANRFDLPGSSGIAELPGNDFMVTLGVWMPQGGTDDDQAGTFMHELGHTLGLYHGGHQQDEAKYNYKPNYHSVMNYTWQINSARPGWRLDYSREALPTLDEHVLDELDGIGGAAGVWTLIGPPPGRSVPETGPVDWDQNGSLTFGPMVDINLVETGGIYVSSIDVLEGSADWSHLLYNFRNSAGFASGASPESTLSTDHMTPQLAAMLAAMGGGPPPCRADIASLGGAPGPDGQVTADDVVFYLGSFFANNLAIADLVGLGGGGAPDGQLTVDDLIAFIAAFFAGCP